MKQCSINNIIVIHMFQVIKISANYTRSKASVQISAPISVDGLSGSRCSKTNALSKSTWLISTGSMTSWLSPPVGDGPWGHTHIFSYQVALRLAFHVLVDCQHGTHAICPHFVRWPVSLCTYFVVIKGFPKPMKYFVDSLNEDYTWIGLSVLRIPVDSIA